MKPRYFPLLLPVPTKKSIALIIAANQHDSCESTRIWRWACASRSSVVSRRGEIRRMVRGRDNVAHRVHACQALSTGLIPARRALKQPFDNKYSYFGERRRGSVSLQSVDSHFAYVRVVRMMRRAGDFFCGNPVNEFDPVGYLGLPSWQ